MSTVESAGTKRVDDGLKRPHASSSAPLAVTIPQAATQLNISQTTVKKLVREGKLRSVLIFGARRIPYSALREFAEKGT
jgi:excisionase family DNA binding protein